MSSKFDAEGCTVVGSCDDYASLHTLLRERWKAMGVTMTSLGALGGMGDSYLEKIMGPGCGKRLGKMSWSVTMQLLGLRLVLVEDPAQTARIKAKAKSVNDRRQSHDVVERSRCKAGSHRGLDDTQFSDNS